jgi:hypothetical protein
MSRFTRSASIHAILSMALVLMLARAAGAAVEPSASEEAALAPSKVAAVIQRALANAPSPPRSQRNDLVTHTSGPPREVSPDIELEAPKPELLPSVLFPPGTGALYSNVGFNVLSRALYDKCNKLEKNPMATC